MRSHVFCLFAGPTEAACPEPLHPLLLSGLSGHSQTAFSSGTRVGVSSWRSPMLGMSSFGSGSM